MILVDTHCHIHDPSYDWWAADELLAAARAAGVEQVIVAGASVADSRRALDFAAKHDGVYATVGIHPGEPNGGTIDDLEAIIKSAPPKLVGLGDIGLDYHYSRDNRLEQIKLFEQLLELAVKHDLPAAFHVREAFDDFWPVLDSFPAVRGTLHSYTDNLANLEKGLSRGLLVSVNGIVTFNKDPELEKVFQAIPLDRLLFETDAPYLTPKPHRGKQNQPAYIREIAQFWAEKRGLDPEIVAKTTTQNAQKLFMTP
jgi:TatD DNase family protein